MSRSLADTSFLLYFVLLSSTLVCAQPSYELNWKELAVPVHAPEIKSVKTTLPSTDQERPLRSSVCTKNCSNWREAPREVRSQLWSDLDEKAEYDAPVTVEIQVSEDYDYYHDRYRKVKDIESWIYRGSYPQHYHQLDGESETDYTVYLKGLDRGNRFEVRITWDDGSHKTIKKTLGDSPQLTYYVNEPAFLEY